VLSEQLAASVKIADTTLEQIRSLALDLRPAMLDDFGLAATLEWFLERQARNSRIKISFQSNLPEPQRFSQVVETVGFRVAQTAFMNIARHSQAQHVHVILNYLDESQELELIIRDDGIGFDVAAAMDMAQRGRSLGLLGLQERVRLVGGWSTVRSTPGVGTEIWVRLPGQMREK
jgi:two-component system sensor histidine kinase UhpB